MNCTPAQSSALREPGLWRADPYLERYHVEGASLVVIALNSGDILTVADTEGGQIAELVAFDSEGQPAPGALGGDPNVPAAGFLTVLANPGAAHVQRGLKRRGIDPAPGRAIRLFSLNSGPGEQHQFSVEKDIVCVEGIRSSSFDTGLSDDLLADGHGQRKTGCHLEFCVELCCTSGYLAQHVDGGDGRGLADLLEPVYEKNLPTHLGRTSKCLVECFETGKPADVEAPFTRCAD